MAKSKGRKTSPRVQRKADRKRKAREKKLRELRSRKRSPQAVDAGQHPPREVSPARKLTADEYAKQVVIPAGGPPLAQLRRIRQEKAQGKRPRPSARMIGEASPPQREVQLKLVDKVAELVDENVFGRSEMCLQFAALLAKALTLLGFDATAKRGTARYRKPGGGWFSWDHAWVEYGECVVDANVDSMRENLLVDEGVDPASFWGQRDRIPDDRQIGFASATFWPGDEDSEYWWPRLEEWLRTEVNRYARTEAAPPAP